MSKNEKTRTKPWFCAFRHLVNAPKREQFDRELTINLVCFKCHPLKRCPKAYLETIHTLTLCIPHRSRGVRYLLVVRSNFLSLLEKSLSDQFILEMSFNFLSVRLNSLSFPISILNPPFADTASSTVTVISVRLYAHSMKSSFESATTICLLYTNINFSATFISHYRCSRTKIPQEIGLVRLT